METLKLKQALIRNDAWLYCVLDGASVPELPKRLFEFGAPHECLMAGDLAPDMMYVAPYLVYLSGEDALSTWVFENAPGKNWGVYLHTRSSITEMRRHLGALLTVYSEDGDPMLFRYYDPRVLRRFLPTCNAGELMTFFGKVEAFFADSEGPGLIRFGLDSGKLNQTELN
jgi:hypothetical protein